MKLKSTPIQKSKAIMDNMVFQGGSMWKDIRKVYKFAKVLGGGHFGFDRVGALKDGGKSKPQYAIKSISKKKLAKKDLESLVKEVEIISSLYHPNIINFYETYQNEQYFHIVMELCQGKELLVKFL